jgi:lipid II:glycine glycyltransferase (peptidoglycan interpeptide bridge formation enzyme)
MGPAATYESAPSYAVDVSSGASDEAWDAFVRAQPDGFYMQSSAWAAFKTSYAWRVARVTISREGKIVAGVQVLLRPLPLIGAVGWAPRAPIVAEASADGQLTRRVLDELDRFAHRHRVQLMLLQPPSGRAPLLRELEHRGYRPTPLTMAPTATIVIDLNRDEAALLGDMRKKTRQHIRKGLREGITVREGARADLSAFYRLHVATSERQSFTPYPENYFSRLWSALEPSGAARLLLAEFEGELVSALLMIAYGDTVSTIAVGWAGAHPRRMPNEVLYWSAITWAKRHGYRRCDLVYIDPRAGAALIEGRPLPEALRESATFFKLGLGGEVCVLPSAFERIQNPVLRVVYRYGLPALLRLKGVRKAVVRLRWQWLPTRGAVSPIASRAALPARPEPRAGA